MKYILSLIFTFMHTVTYAAANNAWGFCAAGKAYSSQPSFTFHSSCGTEHHHMGGRFPGGHFPRACWVGPRKAEADWVCQAPMASATGVEVQANTSRCKNSARKECIVGQGGENGPGDHNVPTGAWYRVPGGEVLDVRCECGCFAHDVMLATPRGHFPISELAEVAKSREVQVSTFSGVSGALRGKDFTVGPEEKDVVTLSTADTTLTITGNHPVLVQQDGEKKMVRADSLSVGSLLCLSNGDTVPVLDRYDHKLMVDFDSVYNVDTKGQYPQAHVIVANGLLMGDLDWQKKLSEFHVRAGHVLKYARAAD